MGLLLLISAGAFVLLSSDAINLLIKQQIEEVGSKVTNQKVTLTKVNMNIVKGAGTLNGLVISNPPKYKAASVFSVQETTLDINLKSLPTELIVIDKIFINKPETVVEFTENGGSNIKEILDAINHNISSGAAEKSQQASSSDKADPIMRVDKFVLAGVALTIDLTKLGNKIHQITLPDIVLTNVGGKKGMPASVLGAELAKQALSAIWQQAKRKQTKVLKDKMTEKIKDKVTEKIGGLLDKFKG